MPSLPLLRPSTFDDLPNVAAAFTTRHGGVSEGAFASLNLGLSTGDEEAHVWENRRRLTEALGFAPEQLVVAGQVHGDRIKTVETPGLHRGYDGLVTCLPGLLLGIVTADCAAVLLADAETGIVGACHSGWRGTVARISAKTVAAMRELGAEPARMRAYVGPCISAERFEVGPEVAEQFDDAYVVRRDDWPRPHVNLKAAIRDQLTGSGVPAGAVEVASGCTMSAPDRFFSYRAHDGTTGRMMGAIGLHVQNATRSR